MVEAVKRAEDGAGTVVRLFESAGATTDATIRFGFPVKRAWLTDLHEERVTELELVDGAVAVPFRGFQIVTLRTE